MIVEPLVQHCSLELTRNTLSASNHAVCVHVCVCARAVSVCSTVVYVLIRLAAQGSRAGGQNPHRPKEKKKPKSKHRQNIAAG